MVANVPGSHLEAAKSALIFFSDVLDIICQRAGDSLSSVRAARISASSLHDAAGQAGARGQTALMALIDEVVERRDALTTSYDLSDVMWAEGRASRMEALSLANNIVNDTLERLPAHIAAAQALAVRMRARAYSGVFDKVAVLKPEDQQYVDQKEQVWKDANKDDCSPFKFVWERTGGFLLNRTTPTMTGSQYVSICVPKWTKVAAVIAGLLLARKLLK